MGKNGVKFQEIFQSNQVESRNFEENDDGEFLIDLDGLGKGKKKTLCTPRDLRKMKNFRNGQNVLEMYPKNEL